MFRFFRLWSSPKAGSSDIATALKSLGFDVLYPTTQSGEWSSSSAPSSSVQVEPRRGDAKFLRSLPSQEEVRERYRKLARLYHPDVSSGDSQRMQTINAAYELLQSSGVLRLPLVNPKDEEKGRPSTSGAAPSTLKKAASFREHRQQRHRRAVPDDFANGDDLSWTLKSSLEWRAMVSSLDHIRPEELQNPANHPLSHSKFFSLEEDATIYRMLRGGATVPQVARTLGKQATFIEKRLHNAQFKLRVQYLLRSEKRNEAQAERKEEVQRDKKQRKQHQPSKSAFSSSGKWSANSSFSGAPGPNMTSRLLRRSPSEDAMPEGMGALSSALRKPVWEPSMPRWKEQSYYADLSLEEKARYDHILPPDVSDVPEERSASKIGRSYANYSRMFGRSTSR